VNGARVALAMPVVSAEFGESPTCIFPDIPEARALLEPCGSVVPLAKEEDFATASTFGAYFGWVQTIIARAADWAETEGLSPDAARAMAAGMMRAGASSVTMRPNDSLDDLVKELCLPGSLTGEGIEILDKGKAFEPWNEALTRIYERIKFE
ncbi:MAG: pyrroline-5-carboxylate reductase dimerization domain-containing protein, partial [Hyphomicrobiales bacterium]